MEDEYGSMLSTASSSAANSASTSKRKEFPDMPSSSTRQPCKVKFHDITQKGKIVFCCEPTSTVSCFLKYFLFKNILK